MLTDELRKKLTASALEARKWAYAPYSNYPVGAALLTASGRIYDGVNIENAAYPDTICAERVAIFKAVSEGERDFVAMAVATINGGSPCGSCRQVLAEFSKEAIVLIVNGDGEVILETTVESLIPTSFGAVDLKNR
jgi:cytidine deaminase